MTYSATRGFVNVLSAWMVPERDGKPVGQTEFTNTQAAAADLPADLKDLIQNWNHLDDYIRRAILKLAS